MSRRINSNGLLWSVNVLLTFNVVALNTMELEVQGATVSSRGKTPRHLRVPTVVVDEENRNGEKGRRRTLERTKLNPVGTNYSPSECAEVTYSRRKYAHRPGISRIARAERTSDLIFYTPREHELSLFSSLYSRNCLKISERR